MTLQIQIPDAFKQDFTSDNFQDFFGRVIADMNCLCGLYEQETARMLTDAFKQAVIIKE